MTNQKNPFKSDEIYGFRTLYREIGYYISRLESYDKALKFFNEAIKKTPLDTRLLIGRDRARAKVTQYEGALEDVNKILSINPDDLTVLADKTQNTYLCCEFEESLVVNFRLLPKREKPESFAIGVMQCTDAIENCVGDRTGRPLRDHFKIIRRLAWKKNYEAHKPFHPTPTRKTKKKKVAPLKEQNTEMEHVYPKLLRLKGKKSAIESADIEIKDSLHSKKNEDDPIPDLTEPFPFKPSQNYTSNINNFMAAKYLDSMYLDKLFLEKIQTATGTNCPNQTGTLNIKQIAKNCHKTVSYKQELLRTRRPLYYIKYQEAKISGALRKRQELELEQQQKTFKKEADSILNKMVAAYSAKKLKLFLDMVEKLKRYCDSKSQKCLPNKSFYTKEIYDKVCKAFYEVYRLNEMQDIFQQHRRIYTLLGIPLRDSREASKDSIISEFSNLFLNYKKEIDRFNHRLEIAVQPEEVCWYYHELSRAELYALDRGVMESFEDVDKAFERIHENFIYFFNIGFPLKRRLKEVTKSLVS